MKNFFTPVFILISSFFLNNVFSQALYPVAIEEKILNSSLIIEGKVLEKRSFWDPGHTMIYTSNKIEVYKIFKGITQPGFIEVVTTGGTVEMQSIEASDLLTLERENIGVFFCYPNSINLISPYTGNQLFDIYASGQGSYTYDLRKKTANAPFVRYSSIEFELYKELIQKIGRNPIIVNPNFTVSAESKPQSPLAPVITSFSPQVVNAGATSDPANNLLTINGSGFNNSPSGAAAVIFDDANDGSGGNTWTVTYNSPLVQSWTDNQIKIKVPSRAGTGDVSVRDSQAVSMTAPTILTVNYSVLTQDATDGSISYSMQSNLMNDNGSGGYTVSYSAGTAGGGVDLNSAPEKSTFQRALNTWKEVAGLNVLDGGSSANQTITSDGECLILFDNTNTGRAPLPAGVLASCYSYNGYCTPLSSNAFQKAEFDIVIRNAGVSIGSATFTSGPCPPGSPYNEIDLETVLLHELGHGLNLAHINDSWEGATYPNTNAAKVMNYAIKNGVSRKSLDYSAYQGAVYCISPKGNSYGACSATLTGIEMVPLTRTEVAQDDCPIVFPSTATPVGTSINFDLVHAKSNKYVDPAYNGINCTGVFGTDITNNVYYALKTNADGGDLNILVSGYTLTPSTVSACPGIGVRIVLFQVNSCPLGQAFPAPLACRSFNRNGNVSPITGLAANTNYLMYIDGIDNTKVNFTLTLNGTSLPVTLVDFKGNLLNSKVNLSWKTTSENNSKEFLVEKSFDGASFSQFAAIDAKGNSSSESSYGVTDENPFSDYTFYRLKIVDKDGRFQYSGIVKIKTPKRTVVVSRIYPNPTSGKMNLQVVADSRKALTVDVFDLLGKKVVNLSLTVEPGINEKPVLVNALAAGTYFIQVKDAAGIIIEKSKFIRY